MAVARLSASCQSRGPAAHLRVPWLALRSDPRLMMARKQVTRVKMHLRVVLVCAASSCRCCLPARARDQHIWTRLFPCAHVSPCALRRSGSLWRLLARVSARHARAAAGLLLESAVISSAPRRVPYDYLFISSAMEMVYTHITCKQ